MLYNIAMLDALLSFADLRHDFALFTLTTVFVVLIRNVAAKFALRVEEKYLARFLVFLFVILLRAIKSRVHTTPHIINHLKDLEKNIVRLKNKTKGGKIELG